MDMKDNPNVLTLQEEPLAYVDPYLPTPEEEFQRYFQGFQGLEDWQVFLVNQRLDHLDEMAAGAIAEVSNQDQRIEHGLISGQGEEFLAAAEVPTEDTAYIYLPDRELFRNSRFVRPTKLHQGVFPVQVDDEVFYKEVSGLPEVIGPNGSLGFNERPRLQFTCISGAEVDIVDEKEELAQRLTPVAEARTLSRQAQFVFSEYFGTKQSYGGYDHVKGSYQTVTVPVMSAMSHVPFPKDTDLFSALERMIELEPSLESLYALKKGWRDLEKSKDLRALEVERLEEDVKSGTADPEKLVTAHRKQEEMKLFNQSSVKRLVAKAKAFNPGKATRFWIQEGEDENTVLPVDETIQDHEYFKARGQAATFVLGVNKLNKTSFETSASARPLFTAKPGVESELAKYGSPYLKPMSFVRIPSISLVKMQKRVNVSDLFQKDVKVEASRTATLVTTKPMSFTSVKFTGTDLVFDREVVSDAKADELVTSKTLTPKRLKPVSFKPIGKSSLVEAQERVCSRDLFEIEPEHKWEDLPPTIQSDSAYKLLPLFRQFTVVMAYVSSGRDPEREGEHPPITKVKEAIKRLQTFKAPNAYHQEDKKSRLRDFQTLLEMMQVGQDLRDDLALRNAELEACKELHAELLQSQGKFFEDTWNTVSDDAKRLIYVVLRSEEDHPGMHFGGSIYSVEGEMKTRNESEEEADGSEFNTRFRDDFMSDLMLSWTIRRFNKIAEYCLRSEGKVECPWVSWQDLHKDLFGNVYSEKFGQRPFLDGGEVKEVEFSDGSIAFDTSEQTHTSFGHPLNGGPTVNFVGHQPLQDVFFQGVWDSLLVQRWGVNYKQMRKGHQERKSRYNDEIDNGYYVFS